MKPTHPNFIGNTYGRLKVLACRSVKGKPHRQYQVRCLLCRLVYWTTSPQGFLHNTTGCKACRINRVGMRAIRGRANAD